jgi:hypothetical protein
MFHQRVRRQALEDLEAESELVVLWGSTTSMLIGCVVSGTGTRKKNTEPKHEQAFPGERQEQD